MSESGLTRRRGAGASAARTSGDEFDGAGASGAAAAAPSNEYRNASASQGALEGRGKVAYDPRDFNDDNESKQQPRLTLMEEVLLLGLKDKAVRFRPGHRGHAHCCTDSQADPPTTGLLVILE